MTIFGFDPSMDSMGYVEHIVGANFTFYMVNSWANFLEYLEFQKYVNK